VVGKNAFQHERIYAELFSDHASAAGGVVALALGAIENALAGCESKSARRALLRMLGGKVRDRIRSTGRIARPGASIIPTGSSRPLPDLDGVKAIGREVREKRFTAMKTNIFVYTRVSRRLATRFARRSKRSCRPNGAA